MKGQVITTGEIIKTASWKIVWFFLGMYLVGYGPRNAGLTGYLTGVLSQFAEDGLMARSDGDRIAHSRFVIGDEQHADRADRRFGHRCFFCPGSSA